MREVTVFKWEQQTVDGSRKHVKVRAKFMVGDATINMETKAELAFYEYQEARMVLEWEAMQRREQAAPNFEAWFKVAAEEYKAHDREYSRKVWAAALLSYRAAPAPAAVTEPAALRYFGAVADRPRTAEEAACWCHACRPVTLDDCRMVLCPTCGNKRCPRADDHRNACGNSNAPGQVPVRETPP